MPSFLGGKSRGAFGQPAFFLAGNRMTIVAFEKEVSLKSLHISLFSKMIVRRYCSFKLEKKTFNTYKWKEKVQKSTGSRRKLSSYESCLQRTSSLCFLHGGELALF